MRALSLLAAAGLALAASPAFAACGDPGTSPSVAGKTYTGSDINTGTTARRPTISNRILFNADCTTTHCHTGEPPQKGRLQTQETKAEHFKRR